MAGTFRTDFARIIALARARLTDDTWPRDQRFQRIQL